MTRNPIGLLERALQFLRHSLGDRSTGQPNQKRTENYLQNPIGLLETALQISAAKANGCDGGDCSCGEGEDCLASGWENALAEGKPMIIGGRGDGDEAEAVLNALAEGKPMFVPPLKPQPKQPAQQQPKSIP